MQQKQRELLKKIFFAGLRAVDPEQAVRSTNRKFERRFERVESGLAERNRRPEQATLGFEHNWRLFTQGRNRSRHDWKMLLQLPEIAANFPTLCYL